MLRPMQKSVAICLLLLLAISALASQRSLEGLKEEAEHAQGGHQAKLASELTEYLVGVADQQFTQGATDQAQATVRDIQKYAQMARDAAIKSQANLKQTEIKLRQTQRRLEDLKRTLPVDDRPPLDAVEKKIGQLRQDLLDTMFPPKKKGTS